MMVPPRLPVLVDPVDGELEVGILALDPDVVPREVVEAEAAGTRHFGLARAEVDVHLKWRDMDLTVFTLFFLFSYFSHRVKN